ncbi:plectin-like [Rhinoraja longicauda]
MEVLWRQFLKFKESDLPNKEAEKNRSKIVFRTLEGAVQEGQLKVAPGYHPLDVEKEWGKLHVSILERERVLRTEFERMERFQRIILKIEQESSVCEEQLKRADILLKADVRLVKGGKPSVSGPMLEQELDSAELLIRSLFNDVQTLKDGRHSQAEAVYRRVFRLHEFLVATRTDYSLRFRSGVQAATQTAVQTTSLQKARVRLGSDGAALQYIQDLVQWVEENQRVIDAAEWGEDLPTVQSQLGSHRGLHQAIEDFRPKIERARADEPHLSPASHSAYCDYLSKLDLQYAKLLNSSKSRLRNLESLNTFVSMATKELMWLNDKEEEEVNYDWSERNTNVAAKKDNYSGLMKELESKEKKVNSIQNTGEKLLRDGHPAKQTIEAFMAALQTQWSWLLQLCCCIEAHLKENTAYFQYFADVKDAETFLKKLQESMRRKYTCDRSMTVTRLEDLLQDSIGEKEQLSDYKAHLSGLSKRATTIVQLKPRSPAQHTRSKLPLHAVCDYKQMEIMVNKGDEYVLVNNSQPSRWKVVSGSGSEALVPSVCFIIPPTNKEAVDAANRSASRSPKIHAELEGIKTNLNSVTEKTRKVLSAPEQLSSAPVLRSELDLTLQKMQRVHSLSTVYLEKLKTIEVVIRSTQEAEDLVKKYEKQLKDVNVVPADSKSLESYKQQLKGMRAEVQGHRPLFDSLEAELANARAVSEQMLQNHSERDVDLDRYRESVQQLRDHWQGVLGQIDSRARELEQLGRQLHYYRQANDWLLHWIQGAKEQQEKLQSVPIRDSTALRQQLQQEQKILQEVEKNRDKVDECEKFAKQYINAIKDYELQLVTYKVQSEPVASPVKKQKLVSASDNVIQEVVDLRTRYIELMTLSSQYLKFITVTLHRLENEEEAAEKMKEEERRRLEEVEAQLERQKELAAAHAKAKVEAEKAAKELQQRIEQEVTRREAVAVDAVQQKQNVQQEFQQLKSSSEMEIKKKTIMVEEVLLSRTKVEEEIRIIHLQLETAQKQKGAAESELLQLKSRADEADRQRKTAQEEAERLLRQVNDETAKKKQAEEELKVKIQAERDAAREKHKALEDLQHFKNVAEEVERRMKQAEIEKEKQLLVTQEVARKSAAAELQSKRISFEEKTLQLEMSLQQEHQTVAQLQQEAAELKRLQEGAETELEKWRQKANEALRLRLQAEGVALQKSLAQEEAEKQKEEADREARRRAKTEESALRQKDMAEQELEKQRRLADQTAGQKLAAEQELIRLRAETDNGEQQRLLLEEELFRLKNEVNQVLHQRKLLEEELARVKAEMEALLLLKVKTEEETRSTSEKTKQILEKEAERMRQLANEAGRLRAVAEEAKRQRQLAEDEAAHQRSEAERILKEKLAAINEGTRLKTEAEMVLKEKEAENEHLRRLAEDEAFQRKLLEEQAIQHKQDIEKRILQLRKSSDMELERQKVVVDETLKHRRIVEEEIRVLKLNFEKASEGKSDLEIELAKLKRVAEETQRSKQEAEEEAERQRRMAGEEAKRRQEAERRVKEILAAEEEAARQRQVALEEVKRLKRRAEEAWKQKEVAEQEADRQVSLAQEAAQQRLVAEEKAHQAAVQQKEEELLQSRLQEQSALGSLREQAEQARRLAEEAQQARVQAEREAAMCRQQAEEAERLQQQAEQEAGLKAQAQQAAEQQRKEAELEAARRAQAEQAALRQKQAADADMEKHKKFAEQTLRQKASVEQELAKVKLRLEQTDYQKEVLDEELQRLKAEVSESMKQKNQAEGELLKVRIQMEELIKLKGRIEKENKMLVLKDKDNTQKHLAEEADKMRQLAEEAARLSVEAQEAARQRRLAEEDLAQQRALADKMLKEKMQAIQEASRLKAEAEMMQKQRDQAQQQAKKLSKDKQEMQQRRHEEAEEFQKALVEERRRQQEISGEAQQLKALVSELTDAQGKAEREALKFKDEAKQIGLRLHETEQSTREKNSIVERLEHQWKQSKQEASELQNAIAELESEKEKLRKEAELLQRKTKEMEAGKNKEIVHTTQVLQQTFLSEKELLIRKEKMIEAEKQKLEHLYEDELEKSKSLKDEQMKEMKRLKDDKARLQDSMDEALMMQRKAEDQVQEKQRQLQEMEKRRQEKEKQLADENQALRESLEQLKAQKLEVMSKETAEVQAATAPTLGALANGRDVVDSAQESAEATFPFSGLRQPVAAARLHQAGILSKKQLDKLKKGSITVKDLSQKEAVQNYLRGKSCVAGLIFQPSKEKVSIYQAMKRGQLKPTTAMVLLEAQAASGFIIDPAKNMKLPVNEAIREGVVGPELQEKLLSAERAVTGYRDPYTGEQISLFQAMQKDLISPSYAIRLLQAQLATGGVIDPVNSHRLPLAQAYKQGIFTEDMNKIVAGDSDNAKAFFDPNTQENLTYLQLLDRCQKDQESGLFLLPLTEGAETKKGGYTMEQTHDIFNTATVSVPVGKFSGKTVTIWELINSEYITEDQRRDLIRQYRSGKITIEHIIKYIITTIDETETKKQLLFPGLRDKVPASELLESKIIDKKTFDGLQKGKATPEDVSKLESVRKFLQGSESIAGVFVEPTQETMSFYQAMKKNLLRPRTAEILLEAQAATGFLVDPVQNRTFSVDEAVKDGLVGPELHEKLLAAEKAVTGYTDPYTGRKVSLFEAMRKELVPKDHGVQLLQAQVASGGIIDPNTSHRLPMDVAYKRGMLDEEMKQLVTTPSENTKGFIEPNTDEHVTYQQLKQRCRSDPETNLSLLPLTEEAVKRVDLHPEEVTKDVFQKAVVSVPSGKFSGKTVTIWELINSEYITEDQRRDLMWQYRSGKITIEHIIKYIITTIDETETKKQLLFPGLRDKVPASELLESKIIDKKTFDGLQKGKATPEDVSKLESVRKFLQGSESIAGVFVEPTQETMSFYQAMKQKLLRPKTAEILLEAQAATGFLVDPVQNRTLTVDEAVKDGLVGPELHEKLLAAEKAVTGYTDPYTGRKVSLFEAMRKELVPKDHGVQLLQAQVASGGIIDPNTSHRLPMDVAYKRGMLDEEMKQLVTTPSENRVSFYDPNMDERVTYQRLKERCRKDAGSGQLLLPLSEKAISSKPVYDEEQTRDTFGQTTVSVPAGIFSGKTVSILELINSEYFTEEQRKDLIRQYRSGKVTVEKIIRIVITVIEEQETKKKPQLLFPGLRDKVPASELLESKIIDKKTFDGLQKGKATPEDVSKLESVRKFLQGSESIAGVFVEPTQETMSFYQAMKKNLLRPRTAEILLEAQAATGFLVDPVQNRTFTVDEAVKDGLVGPELHEKLLAAEKAVTGYTDPYTGRKVSLFEAMRKELVPKDHGVQLLQAQVTSGGIIDPNTSHRLPMDVAYKRGMLDEEMNQLVTTPSENTKGFIEPNTDEHVTYQQLKQRCRNDPKTNLSLLPLTEEAVKRVDLHPEEVTKDIFQKAVVSVPSGKFCGKTVTIWELINSEYITEDQRRDLMWQYRSGKITIEHIIKYIITTIDETETKKQLLFPGLRDKVPASELLESKIIDKKTFDGLQKGKATPEDVSKLESVRKFLQGSESIAGVFVEPTQETMSFYQAMKKNLLRPRTAEILLEAQAATGFLVDPVQNRTFSVDEAVKDGLVGPELHEKLLAAEKAVTGYTDPYTGRKVSLFEAMRKELVPKDHGVQLLQAQVASGGIIDPNTSHRLPMDVAYKRGMLDEGMKQLVTTPTENTKGFIEPNTDEHVTYQQLKQRCRNDPKTNLSLLPLTEEAVKRVDLHPEEVTKDVFQKAVVSVPSGKFSGKTVTIWELINSEYVTEDQRRDLMWQYRSGKITIEHIIKYIITTIDETETKKQLLFPGLRDNVPASELLESKIIDKKMFDGLQKEKATPEDVSKLESVRKFLQGSESIAGVFVEPTQETMSFYQAMKKNLLRPRTAEILLEAQAATGFLVDPVQNRTLTVDEAVKDGLVGPELHEKLLAAEKAVTGYTDPYTGRKVSLFEAMRKELVPKDHGVQLLQAQVASGGIIDPNTSHRLPMDVAYKRGMLDEEMKQLVTTPSEHTMGFYDPNMDERVTYQRLKERCRKDAGSGQLLLHLSEKAISSKPVYDEEQTRDTFGQTTVSVPAGIFAGKTVSILELINSEYFTEEQRKDLIRQYRSGKVTVEKIIRIVITVIEEQETKKKPQLLFPGLRDKVTASELLESKIINRKTFDGLQKGKATPEDVSKLESVRKFLQGSESIAGVFVEPTQETMSFYQAMKKNLLRPRTAEILLEAQAATGFLVDPVQNRTLTVDEAVKDGLVGPELHEKLLAAEKAVTGYTDPYTGRKVSLFEAMRKQLVPKDHGVQLLQAQVASGGIIDPNTSHRLPMDVAYKRGMLDEEMNQLVTTPSENTKGFIEPNTDEQVTYQQLKQRCRNDPKTNLSLLPLTEEAVKRVDIHPEEVTKDVFQKAVVSVPSGKFSGKTVTIWELINSEYITEDQCRDLMWQYRSGKITIEHIIKYIITTIDETETKKQLLFPGLRDKVPASELLESKIIDKKTLDGLQKGKATPEDVSKLESVRKFLQGSESIAGVFVEPTQETMSFYQAMKKNLLRPRTAEILLEAQAATGFLVDPVQNRTFTVDEAVKDGLVGPELHEKLLAAEKAVTGYTDPYTGRKVSLFEAMRKELVPKDHGVQLLQAQVASGGIIDPNTSHRLPMDVAYKRGMLDEEMKQLVTTPSENTKGFIEPNTDEHVTYQQLKQRCRSDPETNLCLLPLTEEAVKRVDLHPEEVTKDVFQKAVVSVPSGKFSGKTVTIWELINSEYITEDQRRDLMWQYRSGKITIEHIIKYIITTIDETEIKKHLHFPGLRDKVPASELLESKIINRKTFDGLQKGKATPEDVSKLESVRKFLQGSESIAGVFVEPTQETMSFYQAMKKNLLRPRTAEILLEAQAATGFLVDPVQNRTFTVDEAVKDGLVGPELHEKLLAAEKAVTGYTDPYTGRKVSLFEAMRKELVPKDHGVQLLQAQVASGGIIDPNTSHRLPMDVAYKRGMLDEEMKQLVTTPSENTVGFYDPNMDERVTYQQLKERCRKDAGSGQLLLPLSEKAISSKPVYDEEQMRDTFGKTTVSVPAGIFSGKTVSILELIKSEYFTEEQRKDLIRQYRSGKVTVEKIIRIVITVIEEQETNKKPQLLLPGLRDKVTASELLESKIIDKKTFDGLQKGKATPEDVSKLESVRKFLQGSESIAGVFVEPTQETMSFYQAMKKNLLSPRTAEILLEAQAATGFLVDPVQNRTFSVDEAVKDGLVGPELHEKLLAAEKAVTGYTDPYTGRKVSLFEAMRKELVRKDHGVQLLQAQVASGGIIDPNTSHRLPMDVAYKRGMLDEEMNQLVTTPSENTKGFIEPNTDEHVTYQQLKQRCRNDPKTNLSLLPLTEEAVKRVDLHPEEVTKDVFQKAVVSVPSGKFSGKTVTIWELINSEYITEDQRRDLMWQYRSGKITIEHIIKYIITTIDETETKKQLLFPGLRDKVPASELLESKIIDKKTFDGLQKGKATPEDVSKLESVSKFLQGSESIAGVFVEPTQETMNFYQAMKKNLLSPRTAEILLEAQAATGFLVDPVQNRTLTVDEAVKDGLVGPELHEKLLAAEKAVTGYTDPYTGRKVSLFEAMRKELVPKDHGVQLLQAQVASGGIIDPNTSHRLPMDVAYKRGMLDEEMKQLVTTPSENTKGFIEPNTDEHVTYQQLKQRCRSDPKTNLSLLPLTEEAVKGVDLHPEEVTKDIFQKAVVSVPSGKFSGKTVTIWELINSEYFTEDQRRDLIRQYRSGKVTVEKIITIVVTIIEERELKRKPQITLAGLRDRVPASELLESHIINKKTFDGLQKGKATPEDVSKLESVRKSLQGSESIAGVFVEPTQETMSFYQAMKKNLLRPRTAEILLEAQAATGFLVDPVLNRTLTVDEAVKDGLVGPELHEKLLAAEKAVTGYTDPYTGRKVSLFEAMRKELVPKDHGVQLLQAQVASGGIIDPNTSHRLPIDVAYKRGMLDEEMNRIFCDAHDDAKRFIDPSTTEEVTYQQLKNMCISVPGTGLYLLPLTDGEKPRIVEKPVYSEAQMQKEFENTKVEIPSGALGGKSMSVWEILQSEYISEQDKARLSREFQMGKLNRERLVLIIIEIIEHVEIHHGYEMISFYSFRGHVSADHLYASGIIDQETLRKLRERQLTVQQVCEMETVKMFLFGTGAVSGVYKAAAKEVLSLYQAMKKDWVKPEVALSLLEAQAATGFILDPMKNLRLTVDEAVRDGVVGPEFHDKLLSAERAVTGYRDPYTGKNISLFQAMRKGLIGKDYAVRLLDAQLATGGIIDPQYSHHLPLEVAFQRGYLDRETYNLITDPASGTQGFLDPSTDEPLTYTRLLAKCKTDEKSGHRLLNLTDRKRLIFKGLRKQVTMDQLIESKIIESSLAQRLEQGETTVEEVSDSIKKYLEGTSCISGVFVEASKERLSIYQAMKKGMIRPGTAFELLEAQAATGYMIDPIKNLKLTVAEAVKAGVVGAEFKDKLMSAERAVTGYKDPYSGKLLSLFQAMQKGLIVKDHGIRLLESQIATGGIIDPEHSHRLPVEMAYERGLFDMEMNKILLDPGDDTKGFFDPNTEENLTYLQLMERCMVDSDTGLCLLPLKEKKRERKTSSKSSVRKRRVVIVDPETGKEMSVYEAYRKGLIDHQTYSELSEQECEWEEVTISSSDGVVKSMITDRRSGKQYDIDDALAKGLIDQGSLDLYRSGALSITEFADMLSGNMSGFRSRSSSVGSSSSYTSQQSSPMRSHMVAWSDPVEETGPVAGILDTGTLEKVSITEAMRRNLVDNITGQRLLEAQACTGGIIDPNTGEKYSVVDAEGKNLVDKIMVDRINLAQKAFHGFEDPRTKSKMSAAQALKKGWLYYEAGQRFLEVQYLTGGLIEPDVAGRVSLDEALGKGTIDARTAQKLRDVGAYAKYITCPKTKLKISYKDAMDRSMVEEGSSLRLLEASSQSTKGYYSPYNVSGAGSSAGSRSGSKTGSRTGSRRGSIDATGSGYSMSFSSSSYTSSSYGRRLPASIPGSRGLSLAAPQSPSSPGEA